MMGLDREGIGYADSSESVRWGSVEMFGAGVGVGNEESRVD